MKNTVVNIVWTNDSRCTYTITDTKYSVIFKYSVKFTLIKDMCKTTLYHGLTLDVTSSNILMAKQTTNLRFIDYIFTFDCKIFSRIQNPIRKVNWKEYIDALK